MTVSADFKLVKEKKVDKLTTLRISKNIASGRIFVEFTCTGPSMTLQKSFQDTYDGKNESERFAKSITSTEELMNYFGFKK
jgi:hypothetical protein